MEFEYKEKDRVLVVNEESSYVEKIGTVKRRGVDEDGRKVYEVELDRPLQGQLEATFFLGSELALCLRPS